MSEASPCPTGWFILKRKKRQIDFSCKGIEYSFNIKGLLLVRTTLPDGDVWYRFPAENEKLFKSVYDEKAAAESLSCGYDHRGLIYR